MELGSRREGSAHQAAVGTEVTGRMPTEAATETDLEQPEAQITGLSGDPLLKRLVDMAQLGWRARLILFSNGQFISGTLVSPKAFRAALAESIRSRPEDIPAFSTLDSIVAAAIDAEDPGPTGLGSPYDVPEPRFIHLADVHMGLPGQPAAPFLRLRLPAVSGFWVTAMEEPAG